MLKYLLSLLLIIICIGANAQSDSTLQDKKDTSTLMTAGGEQSSDPDDEEFNVMIFAIAIAFFGAALGAVMVGSFAVVLFLGVVVLLTIAGIVSASLLIGLYNRSLQAGFKSLLLISGSILGYCIWLDDYMAYQSFFPFRYGRLPGFAEWGR
jgi:hypothetical protein